MLLKSYDLLDSPRDKELSSPTSHAEAENHDIKSPTLKPGPGSRGGLIVQVGSCQFEILVMRSSWTFALILSF